MGQETSTVNGVDACLQVQVRVMNQVLMQIQAGGERGTESTCTGIGVGPHLQVQAQV